MTEAIQNFLKAFANSLNAGTFVKLSLANYKGADPHLQKINIRLIETKKGIRLFFRYRHDARDIVKNYELKDGRTLISKLLGSDFFSGHLFTTEKDMQLDVGRKNARLNVGKPTLKVAPPLVHDRKKDNPIDPHSVYLNALGITTEDRKSVV